MNAWDLIWIPVGLLVWRIVFGSFPINIRKIIGRRDNWTCQKPDCDKSFQTGWWVEAAHIRDSDNDKRQPYYDAPENGEILCVDHHAEDHDRKYLRAKAQGNSKEAHLHYWAAEQIRKKDKRARWWRQKNG